MKTSHQVMEQPASLSGHPVLEFLNTTAMIEGNLQDLLQRDADVVRLLARLGWPTSFQGGGLLDEARQIRKVIRQLIESRKAGRPLALQPLNAFLSQSRSHLELKPGKQSVCDVHRVWEQQTVQQALSPLTEAAAELLAKADFELIRRCEGESCVLWFYDLTRSHRRRWCSMASCGNRHKVAAFRSRLSPL